MIDPFAVRLHMNVFRYAARSQETPDFGFQLWRGEIFGSADPQPLPEWLLADQSNHVWAYKLPDGLHTIKVRTEDAYGHKYEEIMTFEIMEERPPKYFDVAKFAE